MGANTIKINNKWTKFIAHEIPANANPEYVRLILEKTYPMLKLAQTPRWVTSNDWRSNQNAAAMIISFAGTVNV